MYLSERQKLALNNLLYLTKQSKLLDQCSHLAVVAPTQSTFLIQSYNHMETNPVTRKSTPVQFLLSGPWTVEWNLTSICKKACNSRLNSYGGLTAEILMAAAQLSAQNNTAVPAPCCCSFWLLPPDCDWRANQQLSFFSEFVILPTNGSKVFRFMNIRR